MDHTAIHIDQVSKSYGGVKALDTVSFSVGQGELFGVIGPDGAGKTSLFRIITSLMVPDAGRAVVEGLDVVDDYREIRKITGYMPGRFSLYLDLSVEENLSFFATIFGTDIQTNYDLIRDIYVQIEPFKKRKAGKLSGGMKQKLALSCALIHKPRVLVLDEPTTGVDAVSRKEFWEMLKKLKAQGITIIVSTPYMDEASLCDRVALIQKGRIMQIDTPRGVMDGFRQPLYGVTARNMYSLLNGLRLHQQVLSAHRFGDSIHVTLDETKAPETLLKELENSGQKQVSMVRINPNIEDCFMALMNQENG